MPCYPKPKLSVAGLFLRHTLRDSGVLSAASVDTHSAQRRGVEAGPAPWTDTWGLVLRGLPFGAQCSMVAA